MVHNFLVWFLVSLFSFFPLSFSLPLPLSLFSSFLEGGCSPLSPPCLRPWLTLLKSNHCKCSTNNSNYRKQLSVLLFAILTDWIYNIFQICAKTDSIPKLHCAETMCVQNETTHSSRTQEHVLWSAHLNIYVLQNSVPTALFGVFWQKKNIKISKVLAVYCHQFYAILRAPGMSAWPDLWRR